MATPSFPFKFSILISERILLSKVIAVKPCESQEHNKKNVTSIKQNAFEDCTKLETVTLEAKTTNIEPNAFLNCTSLTTVICLASEPPALDITSFSKKGESESDRYAKKITVLVPFESVEKYKNHEIWGTFKEIKGI